MNTNRTLRNLLLLLLLAGVPLGIGAQTKPFQGAVYEGVLTRLVGDPNPATGGSSRRLYFLNTDDGRRLPLDLAGAVMPEAGLHAALNRRIQVIADSPWSYEQKTSAPLRVSGMQTLPFAQDKVTGNQPFVSILCKFAGNANEPRPPSYFLTQLGATAPGFNHYYREASYDLLTLDASAVTTVWVSLPNPRTFYIDGVKTSDTYLDELFDHCTGAADAIVNFAQFYGVNLMFNDAIDDAAWGGGTFRTLDGVEKAWPSTWMPYFGEADSFGWRHHGVLAHEMSHALGAPHSESPDGDEYGSQWDVVSSPGATCATVDANYGCLGQSMNAYAKVTMGIMPASRMATHASGTQTYTVERLAQPPTPTSTIMVRVNIAGTTTRYYTVESRHRTGYDTQLPGDGVIIHVVDTTKERPARIVSPGGTGAGQGGIQAIWAAGATFISVADNVSIKVESIAPDGTAMVTVAPSGGGTPTLGVSPASLDFGGQSMNTTSPAMAVTITNGTASPATVTSVTASTHFAVTHDCATLAAAATCTANVTFTPAAEGALNGTLTIASSAGNPTATLAGTGERSLVTHYYRSILRRAPDAGGKSFWDAEAARMLSLGVNVNETWYSMAGSFYTSAEYLAFGRDDAGFVTDLFNTFFNRAPDGPGLAFWTGQLGSGLPREVALVSFMFSAEFVNFTQAIFGTTAVRAEINTVVDFFRGLLGRLPDNGGLNFWVGQFRTAQCSGGAAVNVQAESISSQYALSAEYAARARNDSQYVGDLYNAFLRRGGDLAGVQFWINQIATSAQTREQVRQQFVASPEFQAKVAAIIAQGCL